MNRDSFLRHIENSRDCEQDRLNMAVNRGLRRARSDRFDTKKLLKLAAACVFTFTMCLTVNLQPLKTAVNEYYRNWNKIPPGSAEVLDGYIKDIADNVMKYLGGE